MTSEADNGDLASSRDVNHLPNPLVLVTEMRERNQNERINIETSCTRHRGSHRHHRLWDERVHRLDCGDTIVNGSYDDHSSNHNQHHGR